jgi:hypothetical protein
MSFLLNFSGSRCVPITIGSLQWMTALRRRSLFVPATRSQQCASVATTLADSSGHVSIATECQGIPVMITSQILCALCVRVVAEPLSHSDEPIARYRFAGSDEAAQAFGMALPTA